jgi:hypothetical protein
VEKAERVHGDVGEVAAAVVHHKVEVDVVRLAKASTRERSGDRDAADEGRGGDEGLHEASSQRDVGD